MMSSLAGEDEAEEVVETMEEYKCAPTLLVILYFAMYARIKVKDAIIVYSQITVE
jgi:hypothetical protein